MSRKMSKAAAGRPAPASVPTVAGLQENAYRPFPRLQDHHVEMGNTNSRLHLTTTATRILREVKAETISRNPKMPKRERNKIAKGVFEEKMVLMFPDVSASERGKVFIKKGGSAFIQRRPIPTHGMPQDSVPLFSEAIDRDAALDYFFSSNDAPTLTSEIRKYRNKIVQWRAAAASGRPSPPSAEIADFERYLTSYEDQQQSADSGDRLAEKWLETSNPIKALQGLAKELETPAPAAEDATEDPIQVPLEDLPDNNPETFEDIRRDWRRGSP